MERYIMALDAGTTSSRCILFDRMGNICSLAQKEFTQFYPQPGWVEQDAMEIWQTQLEAARQAMQQVGAGPGDIASIGIANQRETTVVWNRYTGEPVCRAIVWQCRRTAPDCQALLPKAEMIRKKTGLLPDAYFSGTKLRWILEHVPHARQQAERGELLFGTVETWLIWKLTGGKVHVTDYSNASRTMLFQIQTLQWDEELLRELEIPAQMLPSPMPSSCHYGDTDPALFGWPIPITGAAGDQQAALFGQGCFQPGQAKNTYGTGCFLLMNTGAAPVFSQNGLVTTVAWGLNGTVQYALEGSVFVAGAAIQWLRDEWKMLGSAAESEYLATQVPDTGGCYIVPAFTGLGAPYWDPNARGMILGLTRGTNRCHLIRATLDSLAYQTCDVLAAMERDAGIPLSTLRVDGGAAANRYLLQTQADLTGVPVLRPRCLESTALGAAFLAGLAVGFWKDLEELQHTLSIDRVLEPAIGPQEREARLSGWHRAVECARFWARGEG